jgi:hypothetical protein
MDKHGNIFGAARAENDPLLNAAFVETAEFKNLAYTNDFHVAVGRRGTGKSAIFLKLKESIPKTKTLLIESAAEEHHTLAISETLAAISPKYEHARAASKLLWKASVLAHVSSELIHRRNAHLTTGDEWIERHLERWQLDKKPSVYATASLMLRSAAKSSLQDLLADISANGRTQELQKFCGGWLARNDKKVLLLVDRLDEGWAADPVPTGVLGGLTVAAVELAEAYCPIHILAFVRDNMFRALAHFDADFSRNIEDTSLRLNWTEDSLFLLITERIRVALSLAEQKDLRIWDRFAQNELKGRAGFREVLKHTLYRPRDLLILLNKAYQAARSGGRTHIIGSDIDGAALAISQKRLDDLIKEYDQVLPGTSQFTSAFKGAPTSMSYEYALQLLDRCVIDGSTDAAHSAAVLGSPEEVFFALHGIGFLGTEIAHGEFTFCHDGTQSNTVNLANRRVAVHPCYARALALEDGDVAIEIAEQAEDEAPASEDEASEREVTQSAHLKLRDQRSRQLGKVLVDYTHIDPGDAHASRFEEWVTRAVKVLFSGQIINAELHPNKNAALRRDVVGTNLGATPFWRRMLEDYGCRQVVFEAKNYSELGPAEFNQAVNYGGGAFGKASFIVSRGAAGLDENERAHIKSRYYGQQHLIVILPAELIVLCLRKQRSERRVDYTENTLGRLLDTYERQYLGEQAGRKGKRPKRRR